MNKKEFNRKIDNALEYMEIEHSYTCHVLEEIFRTYKVVSFYKSIINGYDDKGNGMFGNVHNYKRESTNIKRWNNRKTSLEVFRQVMLDEKLYKKL